MATIGSGLIIANGVDVGEEINAKIPVSGSRGRLAGYESGTSQSGALTVSATTADNMQITGAVQITVNNGSSGQYWVKKISITNTGATISLGSSWSWVGGSQPTITNPCLLVLSWDNNRGMACLNTTGS